MRIVESDTGTIQIELDPNEADNLYGWLFQVDTDPIEGEDLDQYFELRGKLEGFVNE